MADGGGDHHGRQVRIGTSLENTTVADNSAAGTSSGGASRSQGAVRDRANSTISGNNGATRIGDGDGYAATGSTSGMPAIRPSRNPTRRDQLDRRGQLGRLPAAGSALYDFVRGRSSSPRPSSPTTPPTRRPTSIAARTATTATSASRSTTRLIENTAGAQIDDAANNIFGTDPQLGPLHDNGGPTQTILPEPRLAGDRRRGRQRPQRPTSAACRAPSTRSRSRTSTAPTAPTSAPPSCRPGENGLPGNGECQGAPALAKTGTEAGETITGTEGSDALTGAGGDDTLQGLGANDCLSGDAGNDTADGGAGEDLIRR